MINSFISLVARDILKNGGQDLKDLAVIFPNKRSGALFRQELISRISGPCWSPGIFSIDDWLTGLSGLETTDRLVELVLLYRVVQGEIPAIDPFADFIDLGETMLADFDDTDKYLADPKMLFSALHEIKQMDSQFDIAADEELVERIRVFWSSFGAGGSTHQKKWLEVWDKLHVIYGKFHSSMGEQGLGTSGNCYRKAAEDLLSGVTTIGPYKRIAFVGFNILTTVEETIFQHLKKAGMASFYWDYHPYYLKSPMEAGKFMNDYLRLFPCPQGFEPFPDGAWDFFDSGVSTKSISVVPVTSNTGQVQALLNDLQHQPGGSRGIILSDEGLFSDLLSSWPDDKLPVNFTSGFPLRDTQAAGLFNTLVKIHSDFSQSAGKSNCSVENVLAFLRHPWAGWLTGEGTGDLIERIERRFPEWVPAGYVEQESRLCPWIGHVSSGAGFLDRILVIGTRLMTIEAHVYNIELAAIGAISKQASKFREVLDHFRIDLDARAMVKLFTQFLHSYKVTLETDREAVNQVTGILETRLLDFEEVFILSFNEGIWPSKSLPGSLIPYSMRKVFNLPTAENRDAMYAYYFYRLIQRTRSLNIYYLTGHRDDVIRSGEKSRYVTQLEYEFPDKMLTRIEPPARVGNTAGPIIIKKEGAVKERLARYLAEGQGSRSLSPSAVNEYLDCSLRFALKRIFDFREPDEISYASEPKGFGILIHQVMNRLYSEFVGKDHGPDCKWLQKVIESPEQLPNLIREEYSRVLKEPGGAPSGGKEILAIEVVRQFLTKILEFDQVNPPDRILGLEEEFQLGYPIDIDGIRHEVRLKGIIDRIDQVPEGIRIVDYKTGNSELNARAIEDLFSRTPAKRPKEVFQVLLYCELFLSRAVAEADLLPCLFRMGRFRAGDRDYRLKIGGRELVYGSVREEFNAGFKSVLEELFNPEIPFVQSEDDQVCRYCPFAGLCSRESYS